MKSRNDLYNPDGYSAELGGYPGREPLFTARELFWFGLFLIFTMLVRHQLGVSVLPPAIMQYIHTDGEPPIPVGKAAFISLAVLTFAHFLMDLGSNLVDIPPAVEEAAQELGTLGLINGVTGIGIFCYLAYNNYSWPAFAVLMMFTAFSLMITLNAMRQVGFWRVLHCVLWGVMVISFLAQMRDRHGQ